MIRQLLKRLVYRLQYLKISKRVTLTGRRNKFGPTAKVIFADGSCKDDIIIGDNSDVYGTLMSQSRGKITIGRYSRLSRNVSIQCVEEVTIGNHVIISRESVISDSNNHPISVKFRKLWSTKFNDPATKMHLSKYASHKGVRICDNVWVGERSRICKGVTIGENSVIGANSVVTKDVPANSIAAGNPARIVRTDIDQLPEPTDCEEFNLYSAKHGKGTDL